MENVLGQTLFKYSNIELKFLVTHLMLYMVFLSLYTANHSIWENKFHPCIRRPLMAHVWVCMTLYNPFTRSSHKDRFAKCPQILHRAPLESALEMVLAARIDIYIRHTRNETYKRKSCFVEIKNLIKFAQHSLPQSTHN